FTESLTPCPSGRWNTGPETRLTGRPEVCPTLRLGQMHGSQIGTSGRSGKAGTGAGEVCVWTVARGV
ncbi:MAG: hypothetical protein WCK27_24275, partial [Verrucomicrobiota bacterium]